MNTIGTCETCGRETCTHPRIRSVSPQKGCRDWSALHPVNPVHPVCSSLTAPPHHRAILSPVEDRDQLDPRDPARRRQLAAVSKAFLPFLALQLFTLPLLASLVTGNLLTIGTGPLDTAITFTPTNLVQVAPSGLDAGPAITIYSTNGFFFQQLNKGDYTVSLPLNRWRQPFTISVLDGSTNAVDITNLLTKPIVYVSTNYVTNALTTEDGTVLQYDP